MGKVRKIFQEIVSEERILVGIIGKGEIVEKLKKELEDKNCEVLVGTYYSTLLDGCRYIFIFEGLLDEKILRKQLKQRGIRFLVVSERFRETEKKRLLHILREELERRNNTKLIFVGDIRMWDREKLSQILMWAMFAKSPNSSTFDFAKEGIDQEEKLTSRKINLKVPSLNFFWSKYVVILLLILSPILVILFNFLSIYGNLKNFKNYAVSGDFERASIYMRKSEEDVKINNFILNTLVNLSGPLGESVFPNWKKINSSLNKVIDIGKDGLSGALVVNSYKNGLIGGNIVWEKKDIEIIKDILEKSRRNLVDIRDNLATVDLMLFPKEQILELINRAGDIVQTGEKFIPILEKISEGEYNFLVLFQNNMELRPTGGFIGSYALFRVSMGRVENVEIHDVYDADGKLLAHVDPPMPIREYMMQPNWFLRDSNFDPDFMLSAQQAQWFLEKETGERVDGVVGVNFNVLKEVLKITGPVYIADYKEYITADNIFIKATTYIQKGFFPGSTAKRDFLSAMVRGVFNTLISRSAGNMIRLLTMVDKSLDEKDILIYTQDETLQKIIEGYGWGGRMVDVYCTLVNCFADYLSIIEANLGVNKANLYVEKKVDMVKRFGENGEMETEVKISYTNSSPSEVFPSGSYKNYLRFYIPRGAVISLIEIDGKEVTRLDIREYEKDKSEVGMWVVVAPQKRVEVKMKYTLFGFSPEYKVYQFFYQKQPGENVSSVKVNFDVPRGWKITPRNFSFEKNSFVYNTDSEYDRVFVVDVGR